ncbi:serine protease HtrA [Maledivibacter halophilus]|uniref:Serine protease, S1-C subfamily, contains C-terminal PDZ domain n=1 Tax=Maledivibacter halophilus TaxID=36842 RepID=A0A1T5MKE8_9FIRM|nr:trypsin-like peptidase domain-containing protein [Maledivibacter halophilus]SKC88454.1 serine protease, S1-C subfamily, contains C-terminal PDZ domain [Maledivibacter halophilus]
MKEDNDFFKRIQQNENNEGKTYSDYEENSSVPVYTPTYYNQNNKRKKRYRLPLFILIIVSLISAIIGGIIGAYIAPTYLYGKYIDVPYIYKPTEKVEIITKDKEMTVASAVAQKAMPSVVGITTVSIQRDFLFGTRRATGLGTGVIVDSRGFILTNAHVVDNGEAEEVKVLLNDGKNLEAKVLWNDVSLDLAVIKVEANNLPVADLGNSDNLTVGETSIAIGNPLGLSFERTVTAGIISGLNRSVPISEYESIDGLIQTDASINPGNSGGPLLNSMGQVIGINTAKIQSGEGLGFAIPVNTAKPIVDEFIEKGEFKKVYLGIRPYDVKQVENSYGDIPGVENGVFIWMVYKDSAAAKAGIHRGDVLISLGGVEIKTVRQLLKELYKYRPEDEITVEIIRDQEKIEKIIKFEGKTYR